MKFAVVDFSKAFDIIAYDKLIQKMHNQGFSKSFLYWTLNYISNRSQYVQFDVNSSNITQSMFRVPQGSILGPVLFDLYINDLQICFKAKAIYDADDITIHEHCKPRKIAFAEMK